MHMLRKIQLAASLIAILFGLGALFDVLTLSSTPSSMIFSNWNLIPLLSPVESVAMGIGLITVAILASFSVRASWQAAQHNDKHALDRWRYVTWGASIMETFGCLIFAMYGSLLYLPSAVALLIVGVAELATILHEVECETHPTPYPHHIIP